METREQWLNVTVLHSLADDYEDFETIVSMVDEWAAEKNMTFTRAEILEALKETIFLGLADVYKMPSQKPITIQKDVLVNSLDDYHFYVTEKGKQLVMEANRNN